MSDKHLTITDIAMQLVKKHGPATGLRLLGLIIFFATEGEAELLKRTAKLMSRDTEKLKEAGVIPKDIQPLELPVYARQLFEQATSDKMRDKIKIAFRKGFEAGLEWEDALDTELAPLEEEPIRFDKTEARRQAKKMNLYGQAKKQEATQEAAQEEEEE